ncbi:MAG: CHAP domain-containing protein [Planctomycetia bacterium]|nr:CHAP domain-containing protein [Planctomycetia bacterium]
MKHLIAILALALGLTAVSAAEPELPEVNRKIVEFCKAHMGKKVANGECAMLVVVAFDKAGAMPWDLLPAPKPPMKPNANVWGTLLGPKDTILPGDIIQFSDVELTGKNGRTLRHHTAVVAQVQGNHRFTIYEQNAAGKTEAQKKVVQLNPLDLNRKTKGDVYFYRPLKSPYPTY